MRVPHFIEEVSRAFLECFSLDGGKTECYGYFLCRLEEEHYAAVNNSMGKRIREDFRTKQTACLWLNEHRVLNINNELCDGLTGERIPDAAERVREEIEREHNRRHAETDQGSV